MKHSEKIGVEVEAGARTSVQVKTFGTDDQLVDLKRRTIRGGVTTVASQAIKLGLQLGATVILARMLTPEDFGLIAMVAAVTGFVTLIKDAGLSMATVQRSEITHAQISTLFWVNVGLSVFAMLIVAVLAPAIAAFYRDDRLVLITLAFASTFIVGGLSAQHIALLGRQMRFGKLAMIEILSMSAGIGTAVVMAIYGAGYWALVGQSVCTLLSACALAWIYSGWCPGLPSRRSGVGSMLRFGGGVTGFQALNYFTRNADTLIIGYALGSGAIGVYSKAYNLLMLPIRQLNGPVGRVMVPSLSRLQNDPERFRRAYLRSVGSLAFVGMPLVSILFVAADEVVFVVLGTGWQDAGEVFRWLAPAALFGTVNVAPGWLCMSLGRAKTQVVWAAFSAPITVAGFIIGAKWGIVGVAAAFSFTWCVLLIVFMAMACYGSPVAFSELMRTLCCPFLLAVVSATGSLLLFSGLDSREVGKVGGLLIKSGALLAIYLLCAWMFPTGRARLKALWTDGRGALCRHVSLQKK